MTTDRLPSRSASEATGDGVLRLRILAAAIDLLDREGRDALTTRAVAAAASVQAPTLYRLFGDKRGLLDAVAEHGFATYLAQKEVRELGPDPVANLRAGWDQHVAFGLAQPAMFAIMAGDPRPGNPSPAAAAGEVHLHRLIHDLAVAGRLRVGERVAADLMRAAGRGTVLTLLDLPPRERDLRLSEVAREAVVAAIVGDAPAAPASGVAGAAITLRAALPEVSALSTGERVLLGEWLDRLIDRQP
ncbi:TetR/AcrR family transcriptional regulator [Deinococcus sp. KSM4-11]|uniref:TetR/AcrR family transcriptional regulator n=1 Tax=Deinococcus sp. KSM4-11 TaxID=2568654 RepID=UPI001F0EE65E|nr:TetR/AcrR family transcriptional regulator [Deinococcus sp. KSM4-11]